MARGPTVKIMLSDGKHGELEMRARRRKITRADAVRAQIALLVADGMNNCAIAYELGICRLTAELWRKRFAKKRLAGLGDAPRSGAPRNIGDEKIAECSSFVFIRTAGMLHSAASTSNSSHQAAWSFVVHTNLSSMSRIPNLVPSPPR